MADEIGAGVDRDQTARSEAPPDHGGAESRRNQLLARDHSVLPACEESKHGVEFLRLGVYTTP